LSNDYKLSPGDCWRSSGDLLEIISGVPHEVPIVTWEILPHKKRESEDSLFLKFNSGY